MSSKTEFRAFEFAASVPWAIQKEALENILTIARRENDIEAVQAKLGRPLQNTRRVTVRDDVAIVPVTGPIFRYASMFTEISGATSVATLATDLTEAIENPRVSSIVLEIDSPGGQAAGISEFANMVRASTKPVTAYVSNLGASAAYWIASAAHEVVIADTAMLGSIGVVAGYTTEKETGRVEIVSSQSPKKRLDVSTDEGKKAAQATVDDLAEVFVSAVSKFRGVDRETVLTKFGEGGLLVGKAAVDAGMADRLGSLESVIAGLSGSETKRKGATMALENKPEAGPVLSLDSLKADHPAIYQAAYNEGLAAGKAAEMQRIQDVEAACLPGHEKLIASLKFDGKTTGGEAAQAVLKAERENRSTALDQFKATAPKPLSQPAQEPPQASAEVSEDLPLEDRCKKKWDAEASLRAEFGGDFAAFLAFEQASGDGLVKILKK